jgi:hypothetical protein
LHPIGVLNDKEVRFIDLNVQQRGRAGASPVLTDPIPVVDDLDSCTINGEHNPRTALVV